MKETIWKPSCETAFIRFAEGREMTSPVSKGDKSTFDYFCKDMMWNLSEIKFSEFLVDKIEDFYDTGIENKKDASFIQTRLSATKEKDDNSNVSYDKVVRALIWRYDPASPVNALYDREEDDRRVEMACRLAGIIGSKKNALHPMLVQSIKDLDNALLLSTAMCIRHIVYSGTANSLLTTEDITFNLTFKAAMISKTTTDVQEMRNIAALLADLLKYHVAAEKEYNKLYGSMAENPELRGQAPTKRRKETVDRVNDYRDLATVEQAVTELEDNDQRESWMSEE